MSILVKRIFLALCFVAATAAGAAAPSRIVLLRHAEKPKDGPELSVRGMRRADALVKLFAPGSSLLERGPVAAIFAMAPDGKDGSVRAIQTMEPTAEALKLKIDSRFKSDETKKLAKAIHKAGELDGRTVIICWDQEELPDLLEDLGWRNGPKDWDGDVFDRLWVLDFEGGEPVAFHDLPQNVAVGK